MKFFKAALLAIALAVTPAIASATECAIATKEQAHEQMAQAKGLTVQDLTASDVSKIIEKKGPPPNAAGTEGIEMELVTKEEIAAINVYQNGCFINRLGPTSIDTINKLLDRSDA